MSRSLVFSALALLATTARAASPNEGWQARATWGFSAYGETLFADVNHIDDKDPQGHMTGIGSESQFSIGRVVAPGRVLGLSIFDVRTLAANRSSSGGFDGAALAGGGRLMVAGPMVDWYFEQLPGLHAQASLGFALARGAFEGSSYGGGASLGLGYDWAVSQRFNLGVMVRATGALTADKRNGDRYIHFTGTAPGLAFSIAYN